MTKVPTINAKKLREDIEGLADLAPTRGMYKIILKSIDDAMDELVELREEVPSDDARVRGMLRRWDDAFREFGEREAYYYQAFLESDDRTVVDAPLFEGKYRDFDFSFVPDWPDIETPWRLANELSTAAVAADMDQDYLDDLKRRFEIIIATFWDSANKQIESQKKAFESAAEEEEAQETGDGQPRVYGWWPVVAVAATALVGAFGAASGYTAAKRDEAGEYVDMTPRDQYIKTAKKVGVGIAIGVIVALLLMLRIRVNRST
jgi:hypothetical protein